MDGTGIHLNPNVRTVGGAMKKWYESKLIWLGIITFTISVLSVTYSGVDWQDFVLLIVGALIVVLRAFSGKGISEG